MWLGCATWIMYLNVIQSLGARTPPPRVEAVLRDDRCKAGLALQVFFLRWYWKKQTCLYLRRSGCLCSFSCFLLRTSAQARTNKLMSGSVAWDMFPRTSAQRALWSPSVVKWSAEAWYDCRETECSFRVVIILHDSTGGRPMPAIDHRSPLPPSPSPSSPIISGIIKGIVIRILPTCKHNNGHKSGQNT